MASTKTNCTVQRCTESVLTCLPLDILCAYMRAVIWGHLCASGCTCTHPHFSVSILVCICNVCVIVSMFFPAAEPARGQCLSWCNRRLILSLCKRLTAIQMTCRWVRELRFWQHSVITRNVCEDNVLSAFGWLMLYFMFETGPLRTQQRLAGSHSVGISQSLMTS